ncbi:hypothetical protein [Kineococcus glutinatus]|uniref:Uncharacterized protein n=1 Tax=Kineococcus glutinatus TaxID=1070872 RepID=A0ABP9HBE9_9ACTN
MAARTRGGKRRYDAKGPVGGVLHRPRDGAPSSGYQGLVMLCGVAEGEGWMPAYWSLGDAVSRRCKRCLRSLSVITTAPGRRGAGLRGEQLTLPLDVR